MPRDVQPRLLLSALVALLLPGCGPGAALVAGFLLADAGSDGGGGGGPGRRGSLQWAFYEDVNDNSRIDGPDRITVAFRDPVTVTGVPDADTVFALDPPGTFGSLATVSPGLGPLEVVITNLDGANLQPNGTYRKDAPSTGVTVLDGQTDLTDAAGQAIPYSPSWVDLWGELRPQVRAAMLRDANGDCMITAGDLLDVTFSGPVDIGTPDPSLAFLLPVSGDSLGPGASFQGGGSPQGVSTVTVVLGSSPSIRQTGTFDPGTLGSGSPSGIDIDEGSGLVADGTVPDIPGRARTPPGVDVGGAGATCDADLLSAIYVDANENGIIDGPDSLRVFFTGAVTIQGMALAQGVFDMEPAGFIDTNSRIVPGSTPEEVVVVDLAGAVFEPNGTYGSDAGSTGLNLWSSQTDILDGQGVPVSRLAMAVEIGGERNPRVLSVSYIDGNSNCAVDAGDTVEVAFTTRVTFTTADPAVAFQLPVSGDSLGTAPVFQGGTPTDVPSATVILGANPLLTPTGVFIPGVQTPGSPSGLDVSATAGVIVDAAYPMVAGSPYASPGRDVEGTSGAMWTTIGDDVHDSWFGFSIACAGDVNGDGYDDVIIGAPRIAGSLDGAGKAYLYLGGAGGLPAVPDWESNGEDLLYANFGRAVASAGDVDNDGFDDILIGAPYLDNLTPDSGKAYLFRGGASGPSAVPAWTSVGEEASSAHFGWTLGTAGDVNNDGYDDILVAAPFWANDDGKVFVFLGGGSGPSVTWDWESAGDGAPDSTFGQAAATAGDVNGDGYSDIIVGAPGYVTTINNEGKAYLHLGGPSGLSMVADWTSSGDDQWSDYYGCAVGTVGDLDQDGCDEFLVGAYGSDSSSPPGSNEGKVFVYLGGTGGPSTLPLWTGRGDNEPGAWFGVAAGPARDVNGDGRPDLVVGAPYGGGNRIGMAFLYLGVSGGLSATPGWSSTGDGQPNAEFGAVVGSAGDVNGDGFADLLVATYLYDSPTGEVGKTYVYCGGF